MEELKKQIVNFSPFDQQEEKDKNYFLHAINFFDDVLTRNNEFLHFTSSALVINKERTKILCVYHNIYQGLVYPGGHADGEEDLLSVAIREVQEETGLLNLTPVSKDIFSIQAFPVNVHLKRGNYISSHIHLDVVYLLQADEKDPIRIKPDENAMVKWIPIEEIPNIFTVYYLPPVVPKLMKKLQML